MPTDTRSGDAPTTTAGPGCQTPLHRHASPTACTTVTSPSGPRTAVITTTRKHSGSGSDPSSSARQRTFSPRPSSCLTSFRCSKRPGPWCSRHANATGRRGNTSSIPTAASILCPTITGNTPKAARGVTPPRRASRPMPAAIWTAKIPLPPGVPGKSRPPRKTARPTQNGNPTSSRRADTPST